DLLVEMLTQAGFEAEVRQLIGPPQNLFDDLLKPAAQTSPTIDPAKLDEWTVRLGLESSPPPLVDPDGSAADAIAGQIVAALPSELGVELPFNDEAPSQIPIVRFRASEDDEWTFADV